MQVIDFGLEELSLGEDPVSKQEIRTKFEDEYLGCNNKSNKSNIFK